MKQITITVPDNCELKQDGNTYTVVEKEEVKVKVGYAFIAKELFRDKSGFYITARGRIIHNDSFDFFTFVDENNCTSQRQAEKLLAINKLMNVAKYLNGDWQPNWKDESEYKYSYSIQIYDGELLIRPTGNIFMEIYFKSEELAKQAIEILGEETIKLALCTDY